ncbi:MAG TPA: hypothetical protein VNH42_00665 [Mariprofundaceae bacterium]|nr:hypothetical protein [Mariprofundaceae bacterium]
MKRLLLRGMGLLLILLCASPAYAAGADDRMVVELHAADVPPDQAQNLLTDIPDMAKLAIARVWDRLVPQARRADVNAADAMALLQRAVPTGDGGLMLVFGSDRVIQYLQSLGITYPEQAPHFHLAMHLINPSGVAMPQSEAVLMDYARQNASRWGYVLDDNGDPLELDWRWLDDRQVSLTVHGNARVPDSQEIRFMAAGDPMPQIQAWLDEVMLKARDAYAVQATAATPSTATPTPPETAVPASSTGPLTLVLTVDQPASLADQVLFEQALAADPHVESLLLSRVDADSRQYLLKLRQPDEGWLSAWFASRGMHAAPTAEGWLAQ